MATLPNSPANDLLPMELPLMSSSEASLAKTSRGLTVFGAADQAWKVSVRGFGASMPASFARYDRASSSWKTCQTSALLDSELFSETWPKSGMMRSGTAYQRPSLAGGIRVKGCGWFRTPVASDWTGSTGKGSRKGTLAESLMLSPGPHHVPLQQRTGCPNPPFLEWLMGFPLEWTAQSGSAEPAPSETP